MLLLALLLCLRQDICRRCSLPADRCPLPYNFISIFLNIASAVSQSVVIFLFYLFSFIFFFFSTRKKLRLSYFFLAYNTALAVIAFICRQYACICVCVCMCATFQCRSVLQPSSTFIGKTRHRNRIRFFRLNFLHF